MTPRRSLLPQIAGGPLDQGGLAGAGGGQDVQDEEPLGLEEAPVPLGQAVVLVQDALFDGERAVVLVGMRMRVLMVVPVGVVMAVRMIVIAIMIMAVCLQAPPSARVPIRRARRRWQRRRVIHIRNPYTRQDTSRLVSCSSRPRRISTLGRAQRVHSQTRSAGSNSSAQAEQ